MNNNGILDDSEIAAYKAHAASGKFKQQIAYGVGAAMVFGIVSTMAQWLLNSVPALSEMSFSVATIAPIAGLVAIGILGVSCLYLSAKFLSENTFHDQDLQARQILAAQGKSPEVTPKVEPAQPIFPAMALADNAAPDATKSDAVAQSVAPATAWADKFADTRSAGDAERGFAERLAPASVPAEVAPAPSPAFTQRLADAAEAAPAVRSA